MMHIEVTLVLGTSRFVSKCSTASEAFDVVCDAWAGLRSMTMDNEDRDKWMERMIAMKNGNLLSCETAHIRVRRVDHGQEAKGHEVRNHRPHPDEDAL